MTETARQMQPQTPDWRRYEIEKRKVPVNLTPAEYEARVREIARRCGV